jgi:hypothetical protein
MSYIRIPPVVIYVSRCRRHYKLVFRSFVGVAESLNRSG